jgi:hypothetical protein
MRKILSFLVLLLFAVTMSAETWVLGERADITQLKAGDVIALKSITTVKADENPSNVWFGAYHTLKSNAFSSGIANFGFGLFPQIKDRSAFELVAGPGHGTAASFYLKEMTSGVVKDVKTNKAGMLCPVCRQGLIIRGNTRYGCSRWREGCTYAEPF